MNDREMIWTVVILAAAYYWFVVKGNGSISSGLQGRRSTGFGGTTWGGGDKRPTRFSNSNKRTNAHQGDRYSPAPVSSNGATGPAQGNVGGARWGGWRSGFTTGNAGSLVANQWPTMQVSSTGSRRIASGVTQVPSYTTIPLTVQGPGGGGTIVADA
jgi:hypothetical protein